jgi:tricarballylate dehydrogenase
MTASQDLGTVVVVGGGNAGLCAALAARETCATVVVVEAGPIRHAGGNTANTAGLMRFAFDGLDDIVSLAPELTADDLACTDFGTYSAEGFPGDLVGVTEHRCDPGLAEKFVIQSLSTLQWMKARGVRFWPAYGRQAFKVDGTCVFGGVVLEAAGGGPGLVESLTRAAAAAGMEIRYECAAAHLLGDGRGVRQRGKLDELESDAVVLAAGGFEANAEWRTRYLGPAWNLGKVRGTRSNTGASSKMALDIGASPAGNWSGCHAVGWDLNAPEFGDLTVGDGFQKHSYPFGVLVNARGERFPDEGADFRNFTCARYGRVILEQPNQFPGRSSITRSNHRLRDEYRIREATRVTADTIEELAAQFEGVDAAMLVETVQRDNSSVRRDVPFDPNVLDGCRTNGIVPPKSNWANPLDVPPFAAYAVTGGITSNFGGLRIDTSGRVLDDAGIPIDGCYGCGELTGGLFFFNSPGGSGLTNGAVCGKIAGPVRPHRARRRPVPDDSHHSNN